MPLFPELILAMILDRVILWTANVTSCGSSGVIRERGWECFAIYHDEVSAGVVVDYLRRNDCPAQVMGSAGTALDSGVQVLVPSELVHRAKWLWAKADLTEAELQYLATGELRGD